MTITNLHLIVSISIHERRALFQTVEARANGGFGVFFFAGDDVAAEGVFVGDEGGAEGLLLLGEVVEADGAGVADGTHIVDCLVLALRHGTYSLHCSVCD